MAEKRKSLGRGLSALLGDAGQDYASLDKVRSSKMVPIETVHAGKYQPRHVFNDDKIEELAASIRANGILQPLVVRRDPNASNGYEIIAGERRWRAAQVARLHEIPVIIKELNDQEALEIALVENIQREDLNDIDEAMAYRRLVDEFGHTQDDLAKALGKSRSHIANTLRLLTLPKAVRLMIVQGNLTAGHARALIGCEKAEKLANDIIAKGLTVRDAERMAKTANQPRVIETSGPKKTEKDADTRALEKDIERTTGLPVHITPKGPGGTIAFTYDTLDQLDDILSRLSHKPSLAEKTPTPLAAKPDVPKAKAPQPPAQKTPQQPTASTALPKIPAPPIRSVPKPAVPKPAVTPQTPKSNQALPPIPAPPKPGTNTAAKPTPKTAPMAGQTPTPPAAQPVKAAAPKPNSNADPYGPLTAAAADASNQPPAEPVRKKEGPDTASKHADGWVQETGPVGDDDDDDD